MGDRGLAGLAFYLKSGLIDGGGAYKFSIYQSPPTNMRKRKITSFRGSDKYMIFWLMLLQATGLYRQHKKKKQQQQQKMLTNKLPMVMKK